MSRELSAHEQEVAQQRWAQLEEFQAAASGMLDELRKRLGIEAGAPLELGPIERHLRARGEELMADPMLRVWWLTRVGACFALELCRRHAGSWFVDPDPEARTFLRPVVGRFGGREDGPRYDPMQLAAAVVDGGEGAAQLLSAIEDELRNL